MRRIIIMTFILGLAASVAWAQDTTKVTAPCACFLSGGGCGCRVRPVNDYSGLNSLRSRLANPSWDGRLPGIGTGLTLEEDTSPFRNYHPDRTGYSGDIFGDFCR